VHHGIVRVIPTGMLALRLHKVRANTSIPMELMIVLLILQQRWSWTKGLLS